MKKRPGKALKPIPEFRSDEEAGAFWMTHDTTEYIDWSKARVVSFPNLRPSTANDFAPPPASRLGSKPPRLPS